MRRHIELGCALLLAAAAPALAQDWFQPNPSLAELTPDEAYARRSAAALKAAGVYGEGALRIDAAGRAFVACHRSYDRPVVVRLDADGRLDPAFGTDGVAEIPVFDIGYRLGLEVDTAGRIVVVGAFSDVLYEPGWSDPESSRSFGAARLLPDGALDTSFSDDGLLEDRWFHGRVHAAGGDRAMLVAETRGTANPYVSQYGLVRIAADGTIDPAYGDGGFARLAYGWDRKDVGGITDFAVDPAGRAVVAVRDAGWGSSYYYGRLEVDADGRVLPLAADYSSPAYVAPGSAVEFDGARRVVALSGGAIRWTSPAQGWGGTFPSPGSMVGLQAAGFQRGAWFYADLLWWHSLDPYDYDPSGDTGLLATASGVDRWVVAQWDWLHDGSGQRRGSIRIQAIDPADPGAIVSCRCVAPGRAPGRVPGPRSAVGDSHGLVDLAVTPDGSTAYVLGIGVVSRVDLLAKKTLPLPDLRVKWLGWPRAVDFGDGRYRVSGRIRVRNVARHDAAMVYGYVGVGDVGLTTSPWDPDPARLYIEPFRVRARSSIVKRVEWEVPYLAGHVGGGLAGTTLSAHFSGELPDADFADNRATSRPLMPVYDPSR